MDYFQILGITVFHNYVADSISLHYTRKVVNKDDLKIDNYYFHNNINILFLSIISHIFSLSLFFFYFFYKYQVIKKSACTEVAFPCQVAQPSIISIVVLMKGNGKVRYHLSRNNPPKWTVLGFHNEITLDICNVPNR